MQRIQQVGFGTQTLQDDAVCVQKSGIHILCHVFVRRFCVVVNELEMMMQTLITSIFSTVYSVEEGVRLLDIFEPLSAREVTEACLMKLAIFISVRRS